MTSSTSLPATHRALVLKSRDEPLHLETRPTPEATPGTAVIRVLVANVLSYSRDIYTGARPYTFPLPMVPGCSAIGRVCAVGNDSVALAPGQLVIVDITVRARDDPSAVMLLGVVDGTTERSKKLFRDAWRDATYAEYARLPLENCIPLNEDRLLGEPAAGGLGYEVHDLMGMARFLVPYGGLLDVGLQPGETVIVSPATGPFGGAAVLMALAMGARVIAMGRNVEILNKLAATYDMVEAVPIVNDVEAEKAALAKFGPIDVFFDISPNVAASSTHFESAISSLKHSARISLMGGIDNLSMPYRWIMRRNLQIRGKWMYEREDIFRFLRLVERGMLKLGTEGRLSTSGKFGLDEWKEAFEAAATLADPWSNVVIVP